MNKHVVLYWVARIVSSVAVMFGVGLIAKNIVGYNTGRPFEPAVMLAVIAGSIVFWSWGHKH